MPYSSMQEQIIELQKRVTLLEGDLKSYDEKSESSIAYINELIARIRTENKLKHKQLADAVNGDSKVIVNALGDRRVERQVRS